MDTAAERVTAERVTARKRLTLKRETLQNLNDPILTTQGWSLWTCDETDVHREQPAAVGRRDAVVDR